MTKFDLIDIDESKLPDVTLSDNQKNSIKKKMKLNLKRFIEGNLNLDIDTSDENILKIEENLGDKKNQTLHSIKYANVLKEIVLAAIEKDCPFTNEEILYKGFLHLGGGSEFENLPAVWTNNPFYCQVYLTNKELLIYTLDNYFRLVAKRQLPIQDIEGVAVTDKDSDGLKYSHKNLILGVNSKTYTSLSGYQLVDENPKDTSNLEKIKYLLITLGVKEYIPKKITSASIIYIIFYTFLSLIFILMIMQSIN